MKILSTIGFVAKYVLIGLGFAALMALLMPEKMPKSFPFKSSHQTKSMQADPAKLSSKLSQQRAKMLAKVSPAVVTIQARSRPYPINSRQCFEGVRNYSEQQNACNYFNNGSGVVIDGQGHIVTNAHVVTFSALGKIFDAAQVLIIEFDNGQKATAKLIGFDAESDIALLKLEQKPAQELSAEPNSNTVTRPFLALEETNSTAVGETVYAIGTPYLGFKQTVTSGIVSAKFFAKVANYVQTDAQLRSGNSGGALVNESGQLVGITALSTQEQDGEKRYQNFAIAASDVARVVRQLQQYGQVKRGWLGLDGDMSINIATIAQQHQLSTAQTEQLQTTISQIPFGLGIIVTAVDGSGPADKAGLKAWDIVTKVNQKPIYSSSDLSASIWNLAPNDKVQVTYLRAGQEQQTEVTLGSRN